VNDNAPMTQDEYLRRLQATSDAWQRSPERRLADLAPNDPEAMRLLDATDDGVDATDDGVDATDDE